MIPNSTCEKITSKQQSFISALIAGNSVVQAAAVVHVDKTTAHRWLKLTAIQAAMQAARQDVYEHTIQSLMSDVAAARTTLMLIMSDTGASHGVRVRAAQIILEQAISIHTTQELDERIRAIEATMAERGL